jgi:hypothetical protein
MGTCSAQRCCSVRRGRVLCGRRGGGPATDPPGPRDLHVSFHALTLVRRGLRTARWTADTAHVQPARGRSHGPRSRRRPGRSRAPGHPCRTHRDGVTSAMRSGCAVTRPRSGDCAASPTCGSWFRRQPAVRVRHVSRDAVRDTRRRDTAPTHDAAADGPAAASRGQLTGGWPTWMARQPNHHIRVLSPTGAQRASYTSDAVPLSWSPDGRSILLSSPRGVALLDPATGGVTDLGPLACGTPILAHWIGD